MTWNWQQPGWPNFSWEASRLQKAEALFLEGVGIAIGVSRHLDEADRSSLDVELMSHEAIDTSAIEVEALDRDSVQSSIRRHLGLAGDQRRVNPAEAGIAEMMVDLYERVTEPLDRATLDRWHRHVVKLPDRTPVKLSISIAPDLQTALHTYAAIYAETYGVDLRALLLKRRVESGADCLPCRAAFLAGVSKRGGRPGPDMKRLLPAGISIAEAPELRAARLDRKDQPLSVGEIVRFGFRLGGADLELCQHRHGPGFLRVHPADTK